MKTGMKIKEMGKSRARASTVLVALGAMSIMLILTTTAVICSEILMKELKGLDKRQQQYWQQGAIPHDSRATNHP